MPVSGTTVVTSVIGAVAAAGITWQAVAYAAASIALTVIARSLQDEPEMPSQADDVLGGRVERNARSTREFLPVVYGKAKIGTNDVFMETTGSDNEDLWIVSTLAEGECEGIEQIDGQDQIFLDEEYPNAFGGNVNYWFKSGSSTQEVESNINSAIPKYDDNLHYVCYIVFKLHFDSDYFQQVPQRNVILKGKRLYDFRDDTTAFSRNPVLALYDYMTNTRYGLGMDANNIDTDSWSECANYCDTKGWTIDLPITGTDNGWDTVQTFLDHFRGVLTWWDGTFYLKYADLNYESSVKTLKDEHLVRDGDGRAQISVSQPGKLNKPDGLKVSWINPDKDYTADQFVVGEEGGVLQEWKMPGATQKSQAGMLAKTHLERSSLDRKISGTFRDDAVELEPHDIVTLDLSALGLSNQLVRITESNIQPRGFVDLSFEYEDIKLYDDEVNIESENVYTCNLPDPKREPPTVDNPNITEEVFHYRKRSFTRLRVTFDYPSGYPPGYIDKIEVWVSDEDANYERLFSVTDDFTLENVEEGESYWIRLKTVSIFGTKTRDTNDYKLQWTVEGQTNKPNDLAGLDAVVNSQTINLYADPLDEEDIESYEFRLGASWSGAILLASLNKPNLSLVGIKPGSHTFWCSALSNNTKYSSNPVSAGATLSDPPIGWSVQHTRSDDYSGGTHDNTEQTTYDSEYYLKCSHTDGVLTGTYTSPVYDIGSVKEVLAYIKTEIAVTGEGSTWDGQISGSTTWNDINHSTRSWNNIFALEEAPQVSMRINYGESSTDLTVERSEILTAVIEGRYFQVEIEITDPSTETNALVKHYDLKLAQ